MVSEHAPDTVAECHNCGFENSPGVRYCGGCGIPIPPPSRSTSKDEIHTTPPQVAQHQAHPETIANRSDINVTTAETADRSPIDITTNRSDIEIDQSRHEHHYHGYGETFVCRCCKQKSTGPQFRCPVCEKDVCGVCWDRQAEACVKCVDKKGARKCPVCGETKGGKSFQLCVFCAGRVCDDPNCWFSPQDHMCATCGEADKNCRADGCGNVVLGAELRKCPQCGKLVCPQCLPEGEKACRWCLAAVPKLPLIAVPAGRSVTIHDATDLQHLVSVPLAHSLRSVSVAQWEAETVLLCGWRSGVYVVHPLEGRLLAAYEANGAECRHGFNGAAVHGHYLYASHRDLGLCRWDIASKRFEANLWAKRIRSNEQYVSCLRATGENELWLSAGRRLFQMAAPDGDTAVTYGGMQQEVWGLGIGAGMVAACGGVAGSPAEGGSWAVWRLGQPGKPFMMGMEPRLAGVAAVQVNGAPCLLAVAQDATVYEIATAGRLEALGAVNLPQIRAVASSGSHLIVAGRPSGEHNTRIVVWDTQTRAVVEFANEQHCLTIASQLTGLAALGR